MCSFPVTINPKGSWSVVQDINQTNEVKEKIKEAVKVIITYTHCIKFYKTEHISSNRYYRNIFLIVHGESKFVDCVGRSPLPMNLHAQELFTKLRIVLKVIRFLIKPNKQHTKLFVPKNYLL